MKKVVVASINPVKIEVARRAFSAVFPDEEFEISGVPSLSGVADQPMEGEARQGALNRLAFVKEKFPEAHYWSSQEGGLFRDGDYLAERAWLAMGEQKGAVTEASTASFRIPRAIAASIESGLELGDAGDKFFGTENSKQGLGCVGHITDGLIDRATYYVPAAILALCQLKHKDWY